MPELFDVQRLDAALATREIPRHAPYLDIGQQIYGFEVPARLRSYRPGVGKRPFRARSTDYGSGGRGLESTGLVKQKVRVRDLYVGCVDCSLSN